MHDRRDGGHDCGGGHEHGHDEHGGGRQHHREERRGDGHGCADRGGPRERREEPCREHEDGPDTRFLQLEMSQLLYAGAESVTKDAFRELLLEAAKARLRERFGDKIAGLAELAVDELLNDVLASLEIEARISARSRERDRRQDRLRDIFADRDANHEAKRGCDSGPPHHDGEGGEGGGKPGAGDDENR